MPDALIATKLQVPRVRAERVARPRLRERLNAGLALPLTLVSAPAGFGKTTLVAEWVAGLDRPSAWLSLDERDSDPVRFLTYLIGALQQVESEAGEATLALITSPGMAGRVASFLPQLVNDINSIPEPFVLVLDDVHLVSGQPVHDALAFLIEQQPEPMHLVIASRADPPLPLARLRARGQLSEIRQEDLRFTPAEADELLREALGSELGSSQVGTLTERTEGWIAGLQMASLALQALPSQPGATPGGAAEFVRTFGGTHRHVADYLVEEVLARQPDDVRAFLLRTSILDRLSGPLCDAVLGESHAGGQMMLEALERANLFVSPLDDRREWYRYHRLFADLLQLRLREADPPIDVDALHRRAAAWYQAQAMLPEAIQHAMRAKDVETAGALIEREAPIAWRQGELVTALGWLESLPNEARRRRPILSIYLATIQFLRAEASSQIEGLLQDAAEADPEGRYAGEVALIRSVLLMYRGEIADGQALAEQAFSRVSAESPFYGLATRVLSGFHMMSGDIDAAERLLEKDLATSERAGDRLGLSASLRRLGSLALLRGELRKAEARYERALELSRDPNGRLWPVAGRIVIHLAEIALERNQLDEADALRSQAAGLLERFLPGWNSETYILLARLEHARGRAAEATAAMRAALERARITETSMDDVYIEILAARLSIWQGDLAAAEPWAKVWISGADRKPRSGGGDLEGMIQSRLFREIGRTTMARYHLSRGEPQQAIDVLNPPLEDRRGLAVWANRVELIALRALAHQALGDPEAALLDLDQALEFAEAEGFVRTFIEEGEPMKRLLIEASHKGRARHYAQHLLGILAGGPAPAPAERRPPPPRGAQLPELVEPLTEREVEVLRLLQTSLTTPEIAGELGVAPSTVRTFVKNVYGKLGVHRRLEAVERARALGLLKN